MSWLSDPARLRRPAARVKAGRPQVLLDLEVGRDGVDDRVDLVLHRLERRPVRGRVVAVDAETLAVLLLGQGLRKHRDLGAERMRVLAGSRSGCP
jgi:hypothetical protein